MQAELRGHVATLSGKWSTLKGKKKYPTEANAFLLGQTHFQKGLGVQERKQEVSDIVSLVKTGRSSTKHNQPP